MPHLLWVTFLTTKVCELFFSSIYHTRVLFYTQKSKRDGYSECNLIKWTKSYKVNIEMFLKSLKQKDNLFSEFENTSGCKFHLLWVYGEFDTKILTRPPAHNFLLATSVIGAYELPTLFLHMSFQMYKW